MDQNYASCVQRAFSYMQYSARYTYDENITFFTKLKKRFSWNVFVFIWSVYPQHPKKFMNKYNNAKPGVND